MDLANPVERLEELAQDTRERLTRFEVRLDQLASKADLHAEINGLTWRLIGAAIAITAAFKFIH
jgi:hypothetical protein